MKESKFQESTGTWSAIGSYQCVHRWLLDHGHPTDNMTVVSVMEFVMTNFAVVLEDYSDEIELNVFGKESHVFGEE